MTVYLHKNCSQASITSFSGFQYSSYEYIVTDSDKTIQMSTAGSSDQYCFREYKLYIEDADDPTATPTEFTNQAHDFLKNFDTSETDVGRYNSVQVGATDQSFLGAGVQTKNYTLKVEVVFRSTENGVASTEATTTVHVDSLCTKVSISNTTV